MTKKTRNIEQDLQQREKAELITIIKLMLEQQPELAWVLQTPLPVAGKGTQPINAGLYRNQIEAAVSAAIEHYRDRTYRETLQNTLAALQNTADEFASKDDYLAALTIYEVLVAAAIKHYFTVETGYLIFTPILIHCIPNGGVLVMTTYWRPRTKDPDPDHPGEKLSALSYLPTEAEESCPCGSGQPFATCCQSLPYWRPVCPNPDMQGYSLARSQVARFPSVATQTVHAFLQDDERLYCVEDRPKRGFWLYWGDPAYDAPPYGTICFGDLELQEPHTLLVSALSNKRMEVLLDLLRPLELGTPQMQFDSLPSPPKPTRKTPGRKRRRSL